MEYRDGCGIVEGKASISTQIGICEGKLDIEEKSCRFQLISRGFVV